MFSGSGGTVSFGPFRYSMSQFTREITRGELPNSRFDRALCQKRLFYKRHEKFNGAKSLGPESADQ